MCTDVRPLLNPAFRFRNEKRYLYAPCGCCPECDDNRARQLYVRARLEYEKSLAVGGCGFMCCLTYSNHNVPSMNINGKYEYVFDKQGVQKFIKRLRQNLAREFKRTYKRDAPAFKYIVTSEFGSDPRCTHRPHYHMIFFFREEVNPNLFKRNFTKATYNRLARKKGSKDAPLRYFGYIKQCEPLDPKRGGIKYSSKYICKDVSYRNQRDYLRLMRAFIYEDIYLQFGIYLKPKNFEEAFTNTCIKSTKDYKKVLKERLRPFTNASQFYLLSQDFGVSAILEKYNERLLQSSSIVLDGYHYPIPKVVETHMLKKYGQEKFDEYKRLRYKKNMYKQLSTLLYDDVLTHQEFNDLKDLVLTSIHRRNGLSFLTPRHCHDDVRESIYETAYNSDVMPLLTRLRQIEARKDSFRSTEAMHVAFQDKKFKEFIEHTKYITNNFVTDL